MTIVLYCYLDNILFLVNGEEVRDLSSIQQSIDVFQEGLLFDLSVCQQEHCRLTILTNLDTHTHIHIHA